MQLAEHSSSHPYKMQKARVIPSSPSGSGGKEKDNTPAAPLRASFPLLVICRGRNLFPPPSPWCSHLIFQLCQKLQPFPVPMQNSLQVPAVLSLLLPRHPLAALVAAGYAQQNVCLQVLSTDRCGQLAGQPGPHLLRS